MILHRRALLVLLASLPLCHVAVAQEIDVLPAEQAFLVAARQDGDGRIAVDFKTVIGSILRPMRHW